MTVDVFVKARVQTTQETLRQIGAEALREKGIEAQIEYATLALEDDLVAFWELAEPYRYGIIRRFLEDIKKQNAADKATRECPSAKESAASAAATGGGQSQDEDQSSIASSRSPKAPQPAAAPSGSVQDIPADQVGRDRPALLFKPAAPQVSGSQFLREQSLIVSKFQSFRPLDEFEIEVKAGKDSKGKDIIHKLPLGEATPAQAATWVRGDSLRRRFVTALLEALGKSMQPHIRIMDQVDDQLVNDVWIRVRNAVGN